MKTARMAQLPMLCLAVQLVTLPLASMTVGLPALVGSGVSLPLATLAALVPATMIAWSLPGMSAADVAAVRNTWLMDRAALLVLIAGMMALGAVMIPVYGTAGVAQALSVGGLGCFGVICDRLCGLRVGAAAPASYLFVCCAIGERAGGRLFFWQFPPDDDACPSIGRLCGRIGRIGMCLPGAGPRAHRGRAHAIRNSYSHARLSAAAARYSTKHVQITGIRDIGIQPEPQRRPGHARGDGFPGSQRDSR